MSLLYRELRRRAAAYLRRERAGHTLQPTALVHEAYLRLVVQDRANWRNLIAAVVSVSGSTLDKARCRR